MKYAQLPASAATMKPTSARSENHFTNGCTRAASRGNRARIGKPREERQADDQEDVQQHLPAGSARHGSSRVRAVGCSDPQNATESGSTTM